MIVVGIPTYNEADNISQLVKEIDRAANTLGINIIIVNADSASTDNTSAIFAKTSTQNKKISIQNDTKGKGRNIYSILHYTASRNEVDGCILIDGDITSFDTSWLANQVAMIGKGYDYIVPAYSRNYQEGNTTNHFAYPLLGMHFNGKAPRQPIAGDFGLSARFAKHMTSQPWHDYAQGYGVDIFLTLHALFDGYKVAEISLGSKIHKPSFNKMIPMFHEVAASYYETSKELPGNRIAWKTSLSQIDHPRLIQTQSLSPTAIEDRRREAIKIYTNTRCLVPEIALGLSTRVTKELWVDVLISHEDMVGRADSRTIADSILPWYLMRVVTYLEDSRDAEKATDEIQQQFNIAVEKWNHEATRH